jgi:hypothetical protein
MMHHVHEVFRHGNWDRGRRVDEELPELVRLLAGDGADIDLVVAEDRIATTVPATGFSRRVRALRGARR